MLILLRLGHRLKRDERMTTHCGLVMRAFGGDGMIFSGDKDDGIINTIEDVVKRWGGRFWIRYERDWKKTVTFYKKKGYLIVHLTMYGEGIQDAVDGIRKHKDVIIIVGSGKVPSEVYDMADINLAVTNQPHSEVAALAIFLHMYFGGEELRRSFDGLFRIIPMKKGKMVSKRINISNLKSKAWRLKRRVKRQG